MKHPRPTKAIAVAIVSTLCLGSLLAQRSAPDYEITSTWLQSKFSLLGASSAATQAKLNNVALPSKAPTKSVRYSFISMNNCSFQFALDSTVMDDKGILLNYSKITYTIPLATVSGVAVQNGVSDPATQRDVNIEGGSNSFTQRTETFVDATPGAKKLDSKAKKAKAAADKEKEQESYQEQSIPDTSTKTNFAFIQLHRSDVNNVDLGPRIVTALSNAVKICKAQVPKNTEPF